MTPDGLPSLTCVDLTRGLGDGESLVIPYVWSGLTSRPALHLNKLSARKAHTLCRWVGVIVLA